MGPLTIYRAYHGSAPAVPHSRAASLGATARSLGSDTHPNANVDPARTALGRSPAWHPPDPKFGFGSPTAKAGERSGRAGVTCDSDEDVPILDFYLGFNRSARERAATTAHTVSPNC